MGRRLKEYAYYIDDEFIDIGTKEYLAELTGVKPSTISYFASPAYRRRTQTGICVFPLDEDGDDE